MAKPILYVDSQNGSDSNSGDLLNPLATLQEAYDQINEGGTIVLQDGDSSSYGDLSITKTVNIQGAYGSTPAIGNLTITDAQGSFQNLIFNSSGISIVNSNKGAIRVSECTFNSVGVGISLTNVNYITVLKNTFSGYNRGILINDAEEVNISSNVFYNNGFKAIEVVTVGRIDLWHNTIHGAAVTGSSALTPDENIRIIYVTLTASNITNKNVPLPGFAVKNTDLDGSGYLGYDIAVNVVEGPSFQYGVDYIGVADGSIVSWSGLDLENDLRVGDILRIMYSEDSDPGGGEAVRVLNVSNPNSTIDSNNIGMTTSNIALGVFFNTSLKIRYNNFFGSNTNYNTIATPTDSEGNFSSDPKYTNVGAGDFTLQSDSPNIDAGDFARWDNIVGEIGVGIVNGSYTGIAGATRENNTPFGRDIDRALVNRRAADKNRLGTGKDYTGDVGAYEFISDSHAGDYFVDEQGYDRAYFGGSGDPFGTIDRAFDPALNDNDINVQGNTVPIIGVAGGSNFGRFRSKNTQLSARSLRVGNQTKNDIVYITPTYPTYDTGAVYVDPDGSDLSGDGSSVKPYRTIGKALLDSSQSIVVAPGFYPQFTGEANKRLIGIPVTKTIPLAWTAYSSAKKTDWNVSGNVSFSGLYIAFTDVSEIDSWDSINKFSFAGDMEAKASVILDTDSLDFAIYGTTTSDKGGVTLKKSVSDLLVQFKLTVGGTSYTFSNTIPSFDFGVRVRVGVKLGGGSITAYAKSSSFSRSKTLALPSIDNWAVNVNTETTGTSKVYNLSVAADSFTSTVIETCTNSYTKRKIYAIQGIN